MEYNNKRLIDRILLIMKTHDISIHRFSTLTLIPESTVRGIFTSRRLVNVDMINRLFLVLTKHPGEYSKEEVAKAFLKILFANDVDDDTLMIIVGCDPGKLGWSQIKCTTGYSYDDQRLAAFLAIIRTQGYGLTLRPMAQLPFAPGACAIHSYEQAVTRPSMEYLFGLLLKLSNPAALYLEMVTPPDSYDTHVPSDRAMKSIVKTFAISEKTRAKLFLKARLARTKQNKKRT